MKTMIKNLPYISLKKAVEKNNLSESETIELLAKYNNRKILVKKKLSENLRDQERTKVLSSIGIALPIKIDNFFETYGLNPKIILDIILGNQSQKETIEAIQQMINQDRIKEVKFNNDIENISSEVIQTCSYEEAKKIITKINKDIILDSSV